MVGSAILQISQTRLPTTLPGQESILNHADKDEVTNTMTGPACLLPHIAQPALSVTEIPQFNRCIALAQPSLAYLKAGTTYTDMQSNPQCIIDLTEAGEIKSPTSGKEMGPFSQTKPVMCNKVSQGAP